MAKAANVSVVTVSRVVNNTSYVSDERALRVRKAIQEMGYRPNEIARNLKQQRTHLIGFVVSSIGNAYFASLLQALEYAVQPEGYNVLVCSTGQDPKRERYYIDWLLSRKVDGIVLNTTNQNDKLVAKLSATTPIVLVNRRVCDPQMHADLVDSDNFGAGYNLAKYVTDLGHRRVGLINGNLLTSPGIERRDGFIRGMSEAGIRIDESYPYVYDGNFLPSSGMEGAARLLSVSPMPTAMVVMNNDMCIGAMKEIRRRGLRVPEDLSLCSFGTINNSELFFVTPTVTELDPKRFGVAAGQLILERIANPALAPRERIYPATMLFGDSARRI